MQTFNGYQYLLIDAANHFGLDKETFDKRIQWATDNIYVLESLAHLADVKPRYTKAVMAIRKAQQGKPTGHLVGFDAICSGLQLMSVMTGCYAGAKATGLVDPDIRADAYTSVTGEMNNILEGTVSVSRQHAKEAVMTSFYGSKAKPKEIFGEDTPELAAFYASLMIVGPGATTLLNVLLDSWQPFALVHEWKLPDGYDARIKVMDTTTARIEVDELDHSTFTYEWKENTGKETGLSNVANVVHSVDAYVLRSLLRRCNYDAKLIFKVKELLEYTNDVNSLMGEPISTAKDEKLTYCIEQYERSGMVDVVILPYLKATNVGYLSVQHVSDLLRVVNQMITHHPFEVVTVHDEFFCHANNMNQLRFHYKEILADLADSEVIGDILSQIHGFDGAYTKLSTDLSSYIRNSNYALS